MIIWVCHFLCHSLGGLGCQLGKSAQLFSSSTPRHWTVPLRGGASRNADRHRYFNSRPDQRRRICICYPLISQPTRGSKYVQARHLKSLEELGCECFANGSVSLLWDLLALTFNPAGFCAHFQQSVRRQAMSSCNCKSGGPSVRTIEAIRHVCRYRFHFFACQYSPALGLARRHTA
jgi:hypothetical protein